MSLIERESVSEGAGGKSLLCKIVANISSNPADGETLSFASDETKNLSVEGGGGQKLAVQKCGKHFRQSRSWRDFVHCL
jgi:hypothetical protein